MKLKWTNRPDESGASGDYGFYKVVRHSETEFTLQVFPNEGGVSEKLGEYKSKDGAKKAAVRHARRVAKAAGGAPEPPKAEDPTVTTLIEAGYAEAAYNLVSMARIVRQWLAEDVDPFTFDGLIDFIAERHMVK